MDPRDLSNYNETIFWETVCLGCKILISGICITIMLEYLGLLGIVCLLLQLQLDLFLLVDESMREKRMREMR